MTALASVLECNVHNKFCDGCTDRQKHFAMRHAVKNNDLASGKRWEIEPYRSS